MNKRGGHPTGASKSGALGDHRDRKVRVIEEALGALNAQRLSHLRRRGVQMLRAQPGEVASPNSEARGQCGDAVPI